ncbi:unannotated protein [freshwater metagenome]|uniref:Unannotated protein n=1 Tax=freshwater metagenome TaxID=449393 RepID=A0A6J7TRV5_9ZZZZ
MEFILPSASKSAKSGDSSKMINTTGGALADATTGGNFELEPVRTGCIWMTNITVRSGAKADRYVANAFTKELRISPITMRPEIPSANAYVMTSRDTPI